MSGLCFDWGHLANIKKTSANDNKGGYKTSKNGLVGTTRLCTLWHAIGHKVRRLKRPLCTLSLSSLLSVVR